MSLLWCGVRKSNSDPNIHLTSVNSQKPLQTKKFGYIELNTGEFVEADKLNIHGPLIGVSPIGEKFILGVVAERKSSVRERNERASKVSEN
jgi:hypothetical protein